MTLRAAPGSAAPEGAAIGEPGRTSPGRPRSSRSVFYLITFISIPTPALSAR